MPNMIQTYFVFHKMASSSLMPSLLIAITVFRFRGCAMSEPVSDFRARKQAIREQAHANRNAQPDKDELSKGICARFMAMPEYAAAKTVMFYIDVRAEVRTRHN